MDDYKRDYAEKSVERYEGEEIRKESVVEREVNILNKASQELIKNAEILENRLTCVLKAQPKSVAEVTPEVTPEESLSKIPSEIRRHRQTIDSANYMLKSILSRLEI